MKRCGKEKTVSSLHTMFEEAGMVLMMHNNGLTAAEATDLRRLMRNAGAGFRVTKNRLALRALEGTPYEVLRGFFNGPTAVTVSSSDPVTAAKATVDYARMHGKLVVIGGAIGETLLDVGGVERLASLPSLNELRTSLASLLQIPLIGVASILKAPAMHLASAFVIYSKGRV